MRMYEIESVMYEAAEKVFGSAYVDQTDWQSVIDLKKDIYRKSIGTVAAYGLFIDLFNQIKISLDDQDQGDVYDR